MASIASMQARQETGSAKRDSTHQHRPGLTDAHDARIRPPHRDQRGVPRALRTVSDADRVTALSRKVDGAV